MLYVSIKWHLNNITGVRTFFESPSSSQMDTSSLLNSLHHLGYQIGGGCIYPPPLPPMEIYPSAEYSGDQNLGPQRRQGPSEDKYNNMEFIISYLPCSLGHFFLNETLPFSEDPNFVTLALYLLKKWFVASMEGTQTHVLYRVCYNYYERKNVFMLEIVATVLGRDD